MDDGLVLHAYVIGKNELPALLNSRAVEAGFVNCFEILN
jgi:hypothetical protein